MNPIQGIDFSEGGFPSIATLKARGIQFVGRYGVSDLSPGGRGITGPEYHSYAANAIGVMLYYERMAKWMVGGWDPEAQADAGPGGWDAGVSGAHDFQQNIANAAIPLNAPMILCHDIDPDPADFHQIDQCLSGAASIIGWDRIGCYGGHLLIDYLAQGGNVKFLVETIAWQYEKGWHPAATVQQYDTANVPFDGVPCDLLRAMVPNYGQVGGIITPVPTTPAPAPKPQPPTTVPGIKLPKGVTVELLGRLYTGSPNNKLVIGDETISFDVNGSVSRAWLRMCLASIPKGESWNEGQFSRIVDRVRRGKNGAGGTDYVLANGKSIHADAKGHVAP